MCVYVYMCMYVYTCVYVCVCMCVCVCICMYKCILFNYCYNYVNYDHTGQHWSALVMTNDELATSNHLSDDIIGYSDRITLILSKQQVKICSPLYIEHCVRMTSTST